MALLAVVSFGVAAGFLWRFSATQSEAALGLGLALGLLAVLFGLAAGSAKTPLLVVDEASVRVRLGRQWIATPWGQVARVEVSERGRLGDGHVAVVPTSASAVLDGASRPARLSAQLNRLLYDAPLAAPFGPATVVSVVDVYAAMTRLGDGRVPVVRLNAESAEPRPTVELTSPDEPTVPILMEADQPTGDQTATTVADADVPTGNDETSPTTSPTPTPTRRTLTDGRRTSRPSRSPRQTRASMRRPLTRRPRPIGRPAAGSPMRKSRRRTNPPLRSRKPMRVAMRRPLTRRPLLVNCPGSPAPTSLRRRGGNNPSSRLVVSASPFATGPPCRGDGSVRKRARHRGTRSSPINWTTRRLHFPRTPSPLSVRSTGLRPNPGRPARCRCGGGHG